jgi:IS30 family transposase
MHAHKRFTVITNVQVYFCDPRSPWQLRAACVDFARA